MMEEIISKPQEKKSWVTPEIVEISNDNILNIKFAAFPENSTPAGTRLS